MQCCMRWTARLGRSCGTAEIKSRRGITGADFQSQMDAHTSAHTTAISTASELESSGTELRFSVAAICKGVNEVKLLVTGAIYIPLLVRRGGCGNAADGVVAHKSCAKDAFRNTACERPPR